MTKIFAKPAAHSTALISRPKGIQLVCPVDSMATLCTAVDNGADWIRLEHSNASEIENHPTPVLTKPRIARAVQFAHDRRCSVALNLANPVAAETWSNLRVLLDDAAHSAVDGIILSDPAMMLFCLSQHPDLPIQFAVSNDRMSGRAIDLLQRRFGISRVVLPRNATVAQIAEIRAQSLVEVEVLAAGRPCAVTNSRHPNDMPQRHSPSATLRPHPMDADTTGVAGPEAASNDGSYFTDGSPDSSALKLLPRLVALGVHAIQIGVQPGKTDHLAHMTRIWREAIDSCSHDLDHYAVKPSWAMELDRMARPPVIL